MAVKIVYSKKFAAKYPTSPVESPDRVVMAAEKLVEAGHKFVEALPACPEDIGRVHGPQHIKMVRQRGLYEPAALSAGGAIAAAELALQDEPAFALVRPPGHHASANRAWGLCFFNNMAIAVQRIRPRAKRI